MSEQQPGRAGFLEDIFIVTGDEPCASCDGSYLVAHCGRTDRGSDGRCVLRNGHSGPCCGEHDVASDWTPVSSCPTCCVCPCGSRSNGTLCPFCGVRMLPGVQPPSFDPSTHRPREARSDG